jgi:hypothetical protein
MKFCIKLWMNTREPQIWKSNASFKFNISGGVCHGPRGPLSHFYMPHKTVRVHGLRSCLSVKFAQASIFCVLNPMIFSIDCRSSDGPLTDFHLLHNIISKKKHGYLQIQLFSKTILNLPAGMPTTTDCP